MDDDIILHNQAKYEYLNAPCLIEDFKKKYLTALNIYLNDDKFKEKTDSLPILKSSAITKYEKLISKEEAELMKKRKLKLKNKNKLQPLNIKTENEKNILNKISNTSPNFHLNKKLNPKSIQVRYIIIDHELVEISLKAIEENNEINNKLTDPFNAYFHEQNPKVRKKALEQIINNIIPNKKFSDVNLKKESSNKIRLNSDSTDTINNNINNEIIKTNNHDDENNNNNNNADNNDIFMRDLEILEKRYKIPELARKKREEKFAPLLKIFKDNCNNNNIITLDQKIDYFAYLYKNKMFNVPKFKKPTMRKTLSKKYNKKQNVKIQANKATNSNNSNNNYGFYTKPSSSSFSVNNLLENNIKYTNELKNNFKINEENFNISALESFQRDIDTKIKSFQILKNNYESSEKFIDKLRLCLRCEEVSPEKIILRNCDITSEKLYFLISKKYFDFGSLKHINLDNNNLGDIGCSYLLFLISNFSTKIDYLNINNNKIGKQSCEILIDILQKNNIKITSLSIGGNKLGDKLFSDLSVAISKNSFIQKLFIKNNDLGKISSVILGTILKYDKKIKLLDVSKNNFGDENISYMLKGLICNTSLETLMMNNMNLTNKSLRIFETTLCINTTLKKLFLEQNKINHKGWRLLSEILNKNRHIEYISLVGNNFENQHINSIIEQQRQIKIRSISKTDYFLQLMSGDEELNLFEYIE